MPEIYRKYIPWHPVKDQRALPLGRNVLHDQASRNFQAAQAHKIASVLHESRDLPLSQTRGSCTAEALCGALDTDPDFTGTPYDQSQADALYDAEIVLEGGDPATDDPGGTGLTVCKAARQLGWIGRYEHAFGLDHALKALTLRPVLFGIDWLSSFDEPDPQTGFVEITGDAYVRGGHEVVAVGLETETQRVWFFNSWGADWGLQGRFCMAWGTLGELLAHEGDATVPIVAHAA